MKIGVVGLGYVGSVTAAVLASKGHSVIGIDIDRKRVEAFASGRLPIFEPNLKETLSKAGKNISFGTDISQLNDAKAIFVCVATPSKEGKIDLSFVEEASKSIKSHSPDAVIVIKSTVVPGTAEKIMKLTGMKVVSNPEFTREGTAINDTIAPDRVVVGSRNIEGYEILRNIWHFVEAPFVETTNENAELIKYASNSFLATKISFINEYANLCERIPNADVTTIALGMGLDHRIGKEFLRAGIGYGGSCFPKDTEAIASFAREIGEKLSIVESAMSVNSLREERVIELCKTHLSSDLKDHKICVLGLSFKDDTDDLRESKSIKLIKGLVADGASVKSYDPVAKNVQLEGSSQTAAECLEGTDLAIVATEWPQFTDTLSSYNGSVIDARRILEPERIKKYIGVGRHT